VLAFIHEDAEAAQGALETVLAHSRGYRGSVQHSFERRAASSCRSLQM
jgi:hypothetical protein